MKLRLTDIAIKKRSLTEKGQVVCWDELTPGFGLRCSTKSKSFVVMYGEKRQLKTLGRYPDMSLSDARMQAKKFMVEFVESGLPSASEGISFEAAKTRFLKDCEGRNKPRTVADYRRLLGKHFDFNVDLREVSRQRVMMVISNLSSTPSEQSHAYVAIRTMMNWCVRHGMLDHSVVPPIKQNITERDRVLSEAELHEVFRHAQETPFPFGPIIQLLILTGQRRSEVGQLRRSWVYGNEVVFPKGFAKNKREHRFPLSLLAQKVILNLPNTGDLLFPSANDFEKPFTNWAWRKKRFDSGLGGVGAYTLHDLRRTFATTHAKIGTPIHVTEKLLNHVSGTISGVAAVYNRHTYSDEMRAAMIGFEKYIEGLAQPR